MEGKKYFLKIYLIMILICCVSCKKRAAPKIVSGKPAKISQFPYLVAFRLKTKSEPVFGAQQYCGGSLISSVKVVSAAHCFFPTKTKPITSFLVTLGIDRLDDGKNAFISGLKTFKVHEKHAETYKNDIAIAILQKAVPANHPVIKPIKLATRTPKPGSMCKVAGWGTTKFGGARSNQLLGATVPVVAHDVCQRIIGTGLPSGMLCAGGSGSPQDSCQGDSGGPLTYNNELVGVVSWGVTCGDTALPGVYADVYFYLDWINGFDDRSKGVSYFQYNFIIVINTLLMPLAWSFIKK